MSNEKSPLIVDGPSGIELLRRGLLNGTLVSLNANGVRKLVAYVDQLRTQIAEAQRERDGMMAGEANLFRKRLAIAVRALESWKCTQCGGEGSVWPYCERCSDSTDDHNCPPRHTCDDCSGTGAHPVARKALDEIAERAEHDEAE
jgi:hypothetical protein